MYFPVSLKLKGRRCLVVGGGAVALRKAKALLEAGAKVTAVAPRFGAAFEKLKDKIVLRRKRYSGPDLHGCTFVVAATSDAELNARVARDAGKRRVFANIVDAPGISDVIIPATMRRGDFTISVSTGGASPILAGKIRRALEKKFPASWGGYVDLLGEIRATVRKGGFSAARKKDILRGLLDKRGFEIYRKRGKAAARAFLAKNICGIV